MRLTRRGFFGRTLGTITAIFVARSAKSSVPPLDLSGVPEWENFATIHTPYLGIVRGGKRAAMYEALGHWLTHDATPGGRLVVSNGEREVYVRIERVKRRI